MLRSVWSLLCLTLLVNGCATSEVQPPPFDGAKAFSYLEKQVAFGPRVPGTAAWRDCRQYFYDHFSAQGLAIDSQSFTFSDPYSKTEVPLVNVIARFRGGAATDLPILLVAHWDCRPRGEQSAALAHRDSPIPGANDGASGCAVLMELATLCKLQPPHSNIDFVLVDGEDWGKSGDIDYYLLGSKHFASKGLHGQYRFGIVLDMVGDARQEIYREVYSERFNPHLNQMVWETAARLGIPTFVDSVRHEVIDDHLSLNVGGVPAIDIIDFDYPHWHTDMDIPANCSAPSLENVGRVIAHIMYNPALWPKNK